MSLTGAMAWPGGLLSFPLEEPSSTASTPRTMKTTTKLRKTRPEVKKDHASPMLLQQPQIRKNVNLLSQKLLTPLS